MLGETFKKKIGLIKCRKFLSLIENQYFMSYDKDVMKNEKLSADKLGCELVKFEDQSCDIPYYSLAEINKIYHEFSANLLKAKDKQFEDPPDKSKAQKIKQSNSLAQNMKLLSKYNSKAGYNNKMETMLAKDIKTMKLNPKNLGEWT